MILGVIVGWILETLSRLRQTRAKLCFSLVATPEHELVDKELRTKTSLSEYRIEIYNIGHSPCCIDSIGLYDGKMTLADGCTVDDTDRVLKPYQCTFYTLMEQEADAIFRYCAEQNIEKCDVVVHSIDGKKYRGKLDISWIHMRATFWANIQSSIVSF